MAEEGEHRKDKGDEYLVLKTTGQIGDLLEEFEDLMEKYPDKKDLRITHQAYSAELTFLNQDDVLEDKAGRFLIKGPQPGKRLIDPDVSDLLRKHAHFAREEGCIRLAVLLDAHATLYDAGYGTTLSYGLVEEMRQHFIPGDVHASEN